MLATLVKYTTDENEMRVLYEYLAEASVVFSRVFPIIHSLLDAKITNVLSLCHDQVPLPCHTATAQLLKEPKPVAIHST